MRRRITIAGLAFAASAVLVGCAPSPADATLERAAEPGDALPDWVELASDYRPNSSRLLGEHDGVSYFLARAESVGVDDDLCVVAVAEEPFAVGGCASSGRGGSGSARGVGSWDFAPGGFRDGEIPEGSVLVHPTLIVSR